jgi:hypothetical protein
MDAFFSGEISRRHEIPETEKLVQELSVVNGYYRRISRESQQGQELWR